MTTSGSVISCPYCILAALETFEQDTLNIERPRPWEPARQQRWDPINPQQSNLLAWREVAVRKRGPFDQWHDGYSDVTSVVEGSVTGLCSSDADALNDFLSASGIDAQLDQLDADHVGLIGVFEMTLELAQFKSDQTIRGENGKEYEGLNVADAVVFDVGHGRLVARFPVWSYDTAYIMMAPRPANSFQLRGATNDLMKKLNNPRTHIGYRGARLPAVNLRAQEDISWLRGMQTNGDVAPWIISRTLLESHLCLKRSGLLARAESRGFIGARPLEVNQPFMVWLTRPNCTRPLFAAWVDYSDWTTLSA